MNAPRPNDTGTTLFSRNGRELIVLLFSLLIAYYLSVTGLDMHALWEDEAVTAGIAKNILLQGKFVSWDGKNIIGPRYSSTLDENLSLVLTPPLHFYVAAASMSVFGINTFAARFPFVLAGILAMVFLALWLKKLMNEDFFMPLPALVAALTPAYLMFCRQSRYYSLSILFSILLLYFWTKYVLDDERYAPKNLLMGSVSAIALFFNHYMNAAAMYAAMPAFLLLPEFRRRKALLFPAVVYALAAIMGVYVLITGNPLKLDFHPIDDISRFERFYILLGRHFRDMGSFEFFPWILSLALLLPFLKKREQLKKEARTAIVILAAMFMYMVFTIIVSPQPVKITAVVDVRYIVVLIPLGCAVTAIALHIIRQYSLPVSVAFFTLLICTNLLYTGFLTGRGNPIALYDHYTNKASKYELPPVPMLDYYYDITTDYETPTEMIINYLTLFPDNATVMFMPEYTAHSPMFYVSNLNYCCQLSEKKPLNPELKKTLPDYLFIERARPDLVIAQGHNATAYQDALDDGYGKGAYRYRGYLRVFWRDLTRPELHWHYFGPPPAKWATGNSIWLFQRNRR